MKTSMKILSPNRINVTMSITMEIGKWNELLDQLSTSYPSWQFGEQISQNIRKFNQEILGEKQP